MTHTFYFSKKHFVYLSKVANKYNNNNWKSVMSRKRARPRVSCYDLWFSLFYLWKIIIRFWRNCLPAKLCGSCTNRGMEKELGCGFNDICLSLSLVVDQRQKVAKIFTRCLWKMVFECCSCTTDYWFIAIFCVHIQIVFLLRKKIPRQLFTSFPSFLENFIALFNQTILQLTSILFKVVWTSLMDYSHWRQCKLSQNIAPSFLFTCYIFCSKIRKWLYNCETSLTEIILNWTTVEHLFRTT